MESKKRKTRFHIMSLAFMVLCAAVFSFQESYASTDVVYKEKRPEKELRVEKPASPEKKETEADKDKKDKYVYNPAGKTDPFVSFLTKAGFSRGSKSLSRREADLSEEELITSKEPETELEKIELSKLTLSAVIKGKSKVWAMVIDPKGRGYFLEKGTKIGTHSGVVDEILCEEKKTDFGVETIKKVVIKIPYRNRNKQIIYRSVDMEMPYVSQ